MLHESLKMIFKVSFLVNLMVKYVDLNHVAKTSPQTHESLLDSDQCLWKGSVYVDNQTAQDTTLLMQKWYDLSRNCSFNNLREFRLYHMVKIV